MIGLNSSKCDLIVSWPIHLDYPLWRQQIKANRDRFAKVIVVFTNMNVGIDYVPFIKEAMVHDNITFLKNDIVEAGDDWRNVAINTALRKSTAKWVFFTEQDFFFNEEFMDVVEEEMENVRYIRAMVGDRVHPCCLILRKDLLGQTRKYFGVVKDVYDHFGFLQYELEGEKYFNIPEEYWKHLGGLSQNMIMLKNGEGANYMPDDFHEYVKDCMKVTVPMHKDFTRLFRDYLGGLKA